MLRNRQGTIPLPRGPPRFPGSNFTLQQVETSRRSFGASKSSERHWPCSDYSDSLAEKWEFLPPFNGGSVTIVTGYLVVKSVVFRCCWIVQNLLFGRNIGRYLNFFFFEAGSRASVFGKHHFFSLKRRCTCACTTTVGHYLAPASSFERQISDTGSAHSRLSGEIWSFKRHAAGASAFPSVSGGRDGVLIPASPHLRKRRRFTDVG